MRDLPHDEEAEADTADVAGHRRPARHRIEQARQQVFGDRLALVVNGDRERLLIDLRGDPHRTSRRTVGDRVGDQVADQLDQPVGASAAHAGADPAVLDRRVRKCDAQIGERLVDQRMEVDVRDLDLEPGADPAAAEVEQVGDQPRRPPVRADEPGQRHLLLRVQAAPRQDVRAHPDHRQRIAQVVAHDGHHLFGEERAVFGQRLLPIALGLGRAQAPAASPAPSPAAPRRGAAPAPARARTCSDPRR